MLKKIAIGIGAILVIFLAIVATRPSTFRVERSLSMSAPAPIVFAEINDLRRWSAWSPWDQIDPNMQKTYGGPESGVGQTYSWQGNQDVGSGTMTISQSLAGESVAIDLAFKEPFESSAKSGLTLKADGENTTATWWMTGENGFGGKLMCMFMDMDAMIGGQYDKGLAALKTITEQKAKEAAAAMAATATPTEAPGSATP